MNYKDMNEDQKAKSDQQYEQKLQKKKQEAEIRMAEFDSLSRKERDHINETGKRLRVVQ